MLQRLKLTTKIYLLPILAFILLLVLAFLSFTMFTALQEKYRDASHTNDFAKATLALAKSAEKLNTLVLTYTYSNKPSDASEVITLYKELKTLTERNRNESPNKEEHFNLIDTHLQKYYTTFITLQKQIQLYDKVDAKKRQGIANIEKAIHNLTNNAAKATFLEYIFNISHNESNLESYFRTYDSKTLDTIKVSLQQLIDSLPKDTQTSTAALKHLTAKERVLINKEVKRYIRHIKKEIQILRANHFLVNVVLAAESYELQYLANRVSEDANTRLRTIAQEITSEIDTVQHTLIFGLLLSLLVLFFASSAISKSLIDPIAALTRTFNALAQGKSDAIIPVYQVNDNIGELTQAAKLFKQQNEKIQDLLTESEKMRESLDEAKNAADNANRSKSSFLANMSHEIRTPLNAIMGFIDLLRKSEDDPKKLEYLKIVQSSSNSLLGVINDILDISKVEDGKLPIENIDFNLQEQISYLIEFYKSTTQEKNISLQLTISDTTPTAINADPLRLKQVVANLLSNAIKYSNNNSKIEIRLNHFNDRLYVEVEDEGIGISKEAQTRIFKAFEQAERSTTRKYGGTGLGLNIAKRLVELMGGELNVKSVEGEGSTFAFFIDAKEAKAYVEAEEHNIQMHFDAHLLVAEDNKTNQMLIKILLDEMGITYTIANDGVEAVEAVDKEEFDAILMDINMPNMDGMQASEIILNKGHKIPIIALTANAMRDDIEHYLKIGMSGHVSKPIDNTKLNEMLSRVLSP